METAMEDLEILAVTVAVAVAEAKEGPHQVQATQRIQ